MQCVPSSHLLSTLTFVSLSCHKDDSSEGELEIDVEDLSLREPKSSSRESSEGRGKGQGSLEEEGGQDNGSDIMGKEVIKNPSPLLIIVTLKKRMVFL